jgi:chemotaxis protein MotB
MRANRSAWIAGFALALTSCVSQGKYDAALTDAQEARTLLRGERVRCRLATEALAQRLSRVASDAEERCKRALGELEQIESSATSCARGLDEATAINQQLRTELEHMGKDVDELLTARGTLASALTDARARLEELRRAQAAAEQRAALFRDVALRLKRMVDSGDLQIALRGGRMVLVLSNDVLFDSGRTLLKPRGKQALGQIAAVLTTLQGRKFQVAGHTDNEPIRLSPYASNWELSAARALEVVRFLVQSGHMRPEALSAAGYGEFDPVSPNDGPENKARNRRIEILLQPNIDEFVAVPETR